MFDRIVVRPQSILGSPTPLDLGALVESMLFYQSIELLVDGASLRQLAHAWTPGGVVEMVARGHLKMIYHDNFASVFTERATSGAERHDIIVGQIKRATGKPAMPAEESISNAFLQATGKKGLSRRAAMRLLDFVHVDSIDNATATRARVDLLNGSYVQAAIDSLLLGLTPKYLSRHPVVFQVDQEGHHLVVRTNIDFDEANAEYHTVVSPQHSSLTPAYLLSHVVALRETVDHAVSAAAEILTNTVYQSLLLNMFEGVAAKRSESERSLGRFHEFAVEGVGSLREAINRDKRPGNVQPILLLLEKAGRFKSWIAGIPANADLAREYYCKCVSSTWADRLPSKVVRWVFFTAAGAGLEKTYPGVGQAAGVAIGAIDTFLLDGLLKGWKPNQFVDTTLVPFVKQRRQ